MNDAQSRDAAMAWFATDWVELGQRQLAAMLEAQQSFAAVAEQMSSAWLSCAQSEATLATDCMSKLTSARSAPEAVAIWGECMSRQFEMLADEGRRAFENSDKAMKTGSRLFPMAAGT